MNAAGEPVLLRPLSLGEIFDRAITLYMRNFALFTAIALVITVPLGIIQYFAGLHADDNFAQMMQAITHPGSVPTPPASSQGQTAWFVLIIGAGLLLNAFAVVAIAIAAGAVYRGGSVRWQDCYARALRRGGAILLTLLAELGSFVVVLFAGAFAMVAVLTVAFLLVRTAPVLSVVGFVVAVALTVAWLIGAILCYLAYALAFNALGIEQVSAGGAIGSGFARIFNRGELLRAVLICLALTVIYFGFSILSVSVAALLEMAHLHLINVIVSAALSTIVTSALGLLMVVYYFDVRVRREGLDLQMQIENLGMPAAMP